MKSATQNSSKCIMNYKNDKKWKNMTWGDTDKIQTYIFSGLAVKIKKFFPIQTTTTFFLLNSTTVKNDSRYLLADWLFRVINVLWNLGYID